MTGRTLACGFMPLVDCAPLVVAKELGFAQEEGFDLQLRRSESWSAVRDRLALGELDAAHLLAPLPIAMTLGLGGMPTALDVLSVLSVNGTVIGVSTDLAAKMRALAAPGDVSDDGGLDFKSAANIGRRLLAAQPERLRIGVPFPVSMHVALLEYWLQSLAGEASGAEPSFDLCTVPPRAMAEAVASGEIDAFCVGEPWGSVAVEAGAAELILPGAAIWGFAPEKVLAVRREWAETNRESAQRLLRAMWRSARWLGNPANRMTASELLARPEYLNVAPEIIERALTGELVIAPTGEAATVPRFLEFFDSAATFPWRSQALWIARSLAARFNLDPEEAARAARTCFRADLYRDLLSNFGVDLPGASEKLEGALDERTPVSSSAGQMYLGPDAFFDGAVFDPTDFA